MLPCDPIKPIKVGAVRNVSADATGILDDGEILTGTPTVTSTTGSTISGEQINSSTKIINNRTVAIAKAVLFSFTASVAGTYKITISVDTDAGQTLKESVLIQVID